MTSSVAASQNTRDEGHLKRMSSKDGTLYTTSTGQSSATESSNQTTKMTPTRVLVGSKSRGREQDALYTTLLSRFNQDKYDSLKGSRYQKQSRLEAAVEKPRVRKAVQNGSDGTLKLNEWGVVVPRDVSELELRDIAAALEDRSQQPANPEQKAKSRCILDKVAKASYAILSPRKLSIR